MPTGMFRIDQVEVSNMIDNPSVRFLGDVFVEGTVASLHVKDRYLHSARNDGGEGRICITEDEYCVWLFKLQHSFAFLDDSAQCGSETCGVDTEEVVGCANLQILEEHFAEFIVVILPGVHDFVMTVFVECSNHP